MEGGLAVRVLVGDGVNVEGGTAVGVGVRIWVLVNVGVNMLIVVSVAVGGEVGDLAPVVVGVFVSAPVG